MDCNLFQPVPTLPKCRIDGKLLVASSCSKSKHRLRSPFIPVKLFRVWLTRLNNVHTSRCWKGFFSKLARVDELPALAPPCCTFQTKQVKKHERRIKHERLQWFLRRGSQWCVSNAISDAPLAFLLRALCFLPSSSISNLSRFAARASWTMNEHCGKTTEWMKQCGKLQVWQWSMVINDDPWWSIFAQS